MKFMKDNKAAPVVALLATIFLIYIKVINFDFISFDDPGYIVNNVIVKSGLSLASMAWAFKTFAMNNWHPVTWLSYLLDIQLFGPRPSWLHLENVLLHTCNSLLAFLLLSYTTRSFWRSLAVAAFFGLHPLHVESVAWISERKDVLSTFFWFLSMLAYSRYGRDNEKSFYLLSLILFCIGIMAKPMLVTLPLILLLWDIWPLNRISLPDFDKGGCLRLLAEKIPFFAVSFLSCAVTYYAQFQGGSVASIESLSLSLRLANAGLSYLKYIGKMFWPSSLAVVYPYDVHLSVLIGAGAGLILAVMTFLVIRFARRNEYLLTGWLWYLVTLVPVIGIVHVGQQAMADRYSYVPLFGLFIILAWGLPDLLANIKYKQEIIAATAGGTLALAAAFTWLQLDYWKDSLSLYMHAADAFNGNYMAYRGIANIFNKEGRYDDAISYADKALKANPNDDIAYSQLAYAVEKKGMTGDAMYYYGESLRINPKFIYSRYNLANLLMMTGHSDEAAYHYRVAVDQHPERLDIRMSYGAAMFRVGNYSEAYNQFNTVLQQEPGNFDALYNMGVLHAMQGHFQESIELFTRALAINPSSATAHYNLGLAYEKLGDRVEAGRHFDEARRIDPTHKIPSHGMPQR